jgi:hypothetical protein
MIFIASDIWQELNSDFDTSLGTTFVPAETVPVIYYLYTVLICQSAFNKK